ncbi:TPA: RNA-binding protein [Vibrio parahaemolyticus]
MKLLVRNLARHMTEQDIRKLFSAYGKVDVIMPDEAEAISALEALNLTNVEKSKIRVKVAQD